MSTLGRFVQKGVVRSIDSGIGLVTSPFRVIAAVDKMRNRISDAGKTPPESDSYQAPSWYLAYKNVFDEVIKAHDRESALIIVNDALSDPNFSSNPHFHQFITELEKALLSGRQKFNGAVGANARESEIFFSTTLRSR